MHIQLMVDTRRISSYRNIRGLYDEAALQFEPHVEILASIKDEYTKGVPRTRSLGQLRKLAS
jgi:hypothetical protein